MISLPHSLLAYWDHYVGTFQMILWAGKQACELNSDSSQSSWQIGIDSPEPWRPVNTLGCCSTIINIISKCAPIDGSINPYSFPVSSSNSVQKGSSLFWSLLSFLDTNTMVHDYSKIPHTEWPSHILVDASHCEPEVSPHCFFSF